MSYVADLGAAARGLPRGISVWMRRALESGWFEIRHGIYDGGPGGSKCPIAAAAEMAGIWSNGVISCGNPDWGDPDAPSPEVEDFAAYFDLHAEDVGIDAAVEVVLDALKHRGVVERAA